MWAGAIFVDFKAATNKMIGLFKFFEIDENEDLNTLIHTKVLYENQLFSIRNSYFQFNKAEMAGSIIRINGLSF